MQRHGNRMYLSAGQRALLELVRILTSSRRDTITLEELAALTGAYYTRSSDGARVANRGRVQDRLARLRFLGVIGYEGVRGRRGHVRIWIHPRRTRAGVGTRAYLARKLGNDSASPLRGSYLSRERGLEAAWRPSLSGRPPRSAGPPGLTGPRWGRRPPRVLYARCPQGHRAIAGRRSWTAGHDRLRAEWRGRCNRCRAEVVESVDLVRAWPARGLSAAELRDPDLRAARIRQALELLADPDTSAELGARIRRDYLEAPPPPAEELRPGSAGAILAQLQRRRGAP